MIYGYLVCFIFSLLLFVFLYLTDVKKSLSQYFMLILLVLSNLGYIVLSTSIKLDNYIFSIKVAYIGGCFIPLLYFLTVCDICKIHIKRIVSLVLLLFQMLIFATVWTIGIHPFYYESIIVKESGELVKTYGIWHTIWMISVYVYFVSSLCITSISISKKKTINRKEVKSMLIFAAISVIIYSFERIVPNDIDTTPFVYIILVSGALIPTYHSNLYTVYENKKIINEKLGEVGYITFNKRLAYMGCNDYASNIFPELSDFVVGKKINTVKRTQITEFIDFIKQFNNHYENENLTNHHHEKGETFCFKDHYYDYKVHTLNNFLNRCCGFIIEFWDETEHYETLKLRENFNQQLKTQVNEQTLRIKYIQAKSVLGFATAVEARDKSTGGHILRTSSVVEIFSEKLKKNNVLKHSDEWYDMVKRAAPMHDFGKIGVREEILTTTARYTPEQYEEMKKHAQIGAEKINFILKDIEEPEFVQIATNVAHYHHEKWDGTGYPEHISGTDIPDEARIMALADVFDALVCKRCYKEAYDFNDAYRIIEESSGSHFDADLAKIFLTCKEELEAYYNSVSRE